jgi:hypothetical protein
VRNTALERAMQLRRVSQEDLARLIRVDPGGKHQGL